MKGIDSSEKRNLPQLNHAKKLKVVHKNPVADSELGDSIPILIDNRPSIASKETSMVEGQSPEMGNYLSLVSPE
jgi:hypothetical protein